MKHLELAALNRLQTLHKEVASVVDVLLAEMCDALQLNPVKIILVQNKITLFFPTVTEATTLLDALGSKPVGSAHQQFDRQYGNKIIDVNAHDKVISVTFDNVETSSVWEDVALKQGDRVIVNIGTSVNPVCHTGTVILVYPIRRRVEVMLDNGDRQEHSVSNRSTGIIGFVKNKRSKQSSIDVRELDKWLDLDRWCASNLFNSEKKGITL